MSPDDDLRVVVDGAVLSRPATGIAHWVRGLFRALERVPGLGCTMAHGPAHLSRGGRLHRVPNLLRERWWYDRGIARIADRERADVLMMPANLSARPGRIPQVVSILDVNFLTQPGTYERTFVRYATWAYRRSIRDASRLTTISEFSRAEICRHLDADPARFSVIYPGLEPVPEAPPGPSPYGRPYALFLGATERHKNVGILLDAWSDRSPAGLDLVIVGQPGRHHAELSERAGRMAGRVHVRGRVDTVERERWLRSASVFVFPSRVEGFGFPPLEAMQRGIPVVASTGGSLPEVLDDGAMFFDPDDARSVATLVEDVMGDDQLRSDLIARGAEVARRYEWSRTGDAIAKMLLLAAGRDSQSG